MRVSLFFLNLSNIARSERFALSNMYRQFIIFSGRSFVITSFFTYELPIMHGWDQVWCTNLNQVDRSIWKWRLRRWQVCAWLGWGLSSKYDNFCFTGKLAPCARLLGWEFLPMFVRYAWMWFIQWDSCFVIESFDQINLRIMSNDWPIENSSSSKSWANSCFLACISRP